jgi:ubiquinone/menaquinone biosynthesis C-methylase UbiE
VIEFTGERVIPGQVNDDLWAEHIARYAFAARYACVKSALDIGSGAGYGVAELAHHAHQVTGVDVAAEAITYARANYVSSGAHFVQASATALPFAAHSFDLATAFEVIEHLVDWRRLLAEARRVLRPEGVFLVSTPNKLYYAESRAKQGPNPFHTHEFEFHEFSKALTEFFPEVTILEQNRMESFAFYPSQVVPQSPDARIDRAPGSPAKAHFFLAVCGGHPAPESHGFIYVPRATNLLREREQHILLLEDNLAKNLSLLRELHQIHEDQTLELERHNRWAFQLEEDLKAARELIGRLQDEMLAEQANATRILAEREDENRQKTEWALETGRILAAKCEELVENVRLLDAAETTVIERTQWAQQLQARLETLEAQFQMLRQSRWLKLGRTVGLGPRVES